VSDRFRKSRPTPSFSAADIEACFVRLRVQLRILVLTPMPKARQYAQWPLPPRWGACVSLR
jgi:hypothetical protein